MSFLRILKRDLLFYRQNNIGTLLLAGVCCAILTGALLVGDSVRYTLLRLGQMRLGRTQFALTCGDRFFRQRLAGELADASGSEIAAILALKGILESADGTIHINHLNIYGVDERFWRLANVPSQRPANWTAEGTLLVSRAVRDRITEPGKELLLRIESFSPLSKDLIFTREQTTAQAWPVQIAEVIADDSGGRFSLQTQQESPLNVFVPIEWLAEKTGHSGQANLLLIPPNPASERTAKDYEKFLKGAVTLSDYDLKLQKIESQDVFELRSPRIFLESPIADAAIKSGTNAYAVFTYFVNEIRSGEKSVPYSMTAAEPENGTLPALGNNEIAINEWLADELTADVGDEIQLRYFQIMPTRKLVEQTATFKVKRIVPMMGPFADPTLMPDFPGLSDAGACRDWDSGVPIDLNKIQPRDEDYWDRFRGTPKAFISLNRAQEIWGNRFGNLTSVRWPAAQNSEPQIHASLLEQIDPIQVGFNIRDVRAAAQQSASGSTDFSGLFGGLSMFLIFSAVILLALVFIFYVESRAGQVGLLLAVGWGWLKIFGLFIAEGAIVALLGCITGAVISVLYAWGLIYLLNTTFWVKALANLRLVFHAEWRTPIIGVCVSFLICVFSIQLALFHRIRKPVHQLLTGTFETWLPVPQARPPMTLWLGIVCFGGAILLPLQSGLKWSQTACFFTTGILLLLAVFFLCAYGLKWLRLKSTSFARCLPQLAIKNIPRHWGRSMIVLVTLACGVFMVIGIGANYRGVGADIQQRDSGCGGFALIAETTIPMTDSPVLTQITQDNIPPISREAGVSFRVYQRDDASCLNLNRPSEPTLLGVQPQRLAQKGAFAFQKTMDDENGASPWLLLDKDLGEHIIPAIGDDPTVVWGLKKNLSDTIPYRDENGRMMKAQIVGILKDSVLQGRLLISEKHFIEHFPSADGYRFFLIDADWKQLHLQAAQMTKQYRDFGMEVIPAADRLARFHEVENTYLAIFLTLGGLGLILGSAGLGLVLVLNVLDRKGELAMMQAVGFQKSSLGRMLFLEHAVLLTAGILAGLIPAAAAVYPVIRTQGMDFPYVMILCTIAAMLISGAVWVRVAVGKALKMNFLDTLRNQ